MVSVIIDNYNYEKYISEAIESVLSQTYTDYEIIIVDDGSKDNSREIIEDYSKKYPDKISAVFKENGGQASAFNTGFLKAKGDIIAFLDSDDYWYPSKLEKIVKAHENYGLVGHNKHYSQGSSNKEGKKFITQRQEILKEYGIPYLLITSTISIKRNILEKIFPMPEERFRICADNYLMIYALYLSDFYYIDEELTFYRIHGSNGYARRRDVMSVTEITRMSIELINKKLSLNNQPQIPYIDYEIYKKLHKEKEDFEIEPKKYVLYGTGSYSRIVKKYFDYCGAEIKYYCDSNSEKWETVFEGVKVISPQELCTKRNEYHKIFIASMWIFEISETLNKLGLKKDIDYIYSEIGF